MASVRDSSARTRASMASRKSVGQHRQIQPDGQAGGKEYGVAAPRATQVAPARSEVRLHATPPPGSRRKHLRCPMTAAPASMQPVARPPRKSTRNGCGSNPDASARRLTRDHRAPGGRPPKAARAADDDRRGLRACRDRRACRARHSQRFAQRRWRTIGAAGPVQETTERLLAKRVDHKHGFFRRQPPDRPCGEGQFLR